MESSSSKGISEAARLHPLLCKLALQALSQLEAYNNEKGDDDYFKSDDPNANNPPIEELSKPSALIFTLSVPLLLDYNVILILLLSGDGVVGGGSGAAIGANDDPIAVFKIKNHYDYDHTVAVTVEGTVEQHNITVDNPSTAFKDEEKLNILAGLPWHFVDEVYILINCGDVFHWVLVVIILKERHIQVYESMLGRRCSRSSLEIQNLAKILPTYLDINGSLDQKVRTDWSTIEAYRDKMGNPFDVEYVEGIAQQPIGSL
ncbi:hypothetical protein BC332_28098 [Capsicum chinense]|nr:hypothetical protein BC332_28098 [Capsicum chinense]